MQQIKISQSITQRSATLDAYLNQVSRIPMITPEEEVELAARAHGGDSEALNKLIEANLRFVVSVAKKYQSSGAPLVDIIQYGNMGLIQAAERFDETRGFKFISYAVWWIRQSILSGLAENTRMVRLPPNQVGLLGKINRAKESFEQANGREPDEDEIADLIDFSTGKVKEVIRAGARHMSYDRPLGDEDDAGTMHDVMADTAISSPDTGIDQQFLQTDLEAALKILPNREIRILRMYYGIGYRKPYSLEDISELMDLTRERTRQLRDKAIRTIRQSPAAIHSLNRYL